MSIASRLRMVRSPPQNGSRNGSGNGHDIRMAWTSVIFTDINLGSHYNLDAREAIVEYRRSGIEQVNEARKLIRMATRSGLAASTSSALGKSRTVSFTSDNFGFKCRTRWIVFENFR